ncbi:MAG TPA: GNAT family N-acetyltransferase [Anaerolineaceae bacterium]
MIELIPSQYSCALSLLAGFPQHVLPFAICDGYNKGRVFTDRAQNPRVALVWSSVGYLCLAGEIGEAGNVDDLHRTLTEILIPASLAGGETSLILIASPSAWKERFASLLPGRNMIEIFRQPFAFNPALFMNLPRPEIPVGMRLIPIDAMLAEKAGILASWASLNDFLSNGIGYALLDGEAVASICTSVFTSRERVEIDVQTAEPYRRRGLATIVASALIEESLRRGRQPNWECFWDNRPSIALAGRLGFTPLPPYPVAYWEEPRP